MQHLMIFILFTALMSKEALSRPQIVQDFSYSVEDNGRWHITRDRLKDYDWSKRFPDLDTDPIWKSRRKRSTTFGEYAATGQNDVKTDNADAALDEQGNAAIWTADNEKLMDDPPKLFLRFVEILLRSLLTKN